MGSEKKASSNSVLSQSIFNTPYVPSPTWRSHLTSGFIHGAIILALLLITFPALKEGVEKQRFDNVTLIAPRIPESRTKITIPPRTVQPQKLIVKNEKPKPPALKVKPVTVPRPIIAAAPEIKPQSVTPVRPLPDLKPEPPARSRKFAPGASKRPKPPRRRSRQRSRK